MAAAFSNVHATAKMRGIDALRGAAAVGVVILHLTHTLVGPKDFGREAFGGLLVFGRAGVDFFFVLSGFIITYIHFEDVGKRPVFRLFWAKRLVRIYPTYWAVTALFGMLLVISPTPDRNERDVWHVVSSLLLLPDMAGPIIGVAWSLRHEMLFYGLFSLLILHRHLGRAAMVGWLALIVFNMTVQCLSGTPFFDGLWGDIVFRGFNVEFFFGVAAAAIVRMGMVRWAGPLAAIGGVGFVATGLLLESFRLVPMFEWPIRHLAYASCASLVIYGVATLDRTGRARVPRLASRLGAASYSIYLTHLPGMLVFEYVLRPAHALVSMPVEVAFVPILIATVWGGVVFSECVEQPILRFTRHRIDANLTREDLVVRADRISS